MKKAFPANINGTIFYIDEDAYNLLNNYLTQLRAAFPGPEGEEIVTDIESRIGELFAERTASGQGVIVIDDVNRVIDIMGQPDALSADGDDTADSTSKTTTPPPYHGTPAKKRLFRDERDKVFGGVLSGLGLYLGWDITVLRILAVVVACCTFFWPCVLIYLVAWMVIPPARTQREILEMQGEQVTVGNIGQNMVNTAASAAAAAGGVVTSLFKIVGSFFLGLFGLCGAIAAVTTIILALCLIAGMICLSAGAGFGLLDALNVSIASPYLQGWGLTCIMLAIALPMLALAWAGSTVLFKAPTMSRGIVAAGIIFEVLLITASAILMNLSVHC